jgi:hypothetical protein
MIRIVIVIPLLFGRLFLVMVSLLMEFFHSLVESVVGMFMRGIVGVSASSIYWSDCPLSVVLDCTSSSREFATNSVTNLWIRIDFKHNRIKATHYSIRSRTDGDSYHLRSWVVEGSNNGENWVNLDVQENNCDLTGPGADHTFVVGNPDICHNIRIRQTGSNSSNTHHLIVKSIEFFGTLLRATQ